MNTSYYHSLSAGLSRLESSLPEGLEAEERSAIRTAISAIRSWISTQLAEIQRIEQERREAARRKEEERQKRLQQSQQE